LRNAETDLFDNYYSKPRANGIFISYSNKDKKLAGKIRNSLAQSLKNVEIFLAHHDIEVSKEWRQEIQQHLEKSDLLIAILTPNFKSSVWTNQETGFALGKGTTVIPLIVEGTDIREFGFVEEKQGITIKEDDLGKVTFPKEKRFLSPNKCYKWHSPAPPCKDSLLDYPLNFEIEPSRTLAVSWRHWLGCSLFRKLQGWDMEERSIVDRHCCFSLLPIK
jgi:hypothetical protein